MSKNIGVTTWGQKRSNSNNLNNDTPRFLFMKLKDGSNVLRIITAPFRYEFARVNGPKAKSHFGDRVNAAHPDVCPARKGGIYIGERYYAGVYDPKDEENPIKVLDMSTLVYDALTENLEVLKEEHDRDVTPDEFDINVRYNKGSKNPGQTYSVITRSLEPLSEDVQKLVDEKMDDLVRYLTMKSAYYKPETVQKRMDEIGWTPEIQKEVNEKTKKNRKSDDGLKTSDDTDYSFDKPASAPAN